MTTEIDICSQLEELRAIVDEREQLAARDSELSKRKSEIELALISYHQASGLESVKGGGMAISFSEAMRATYDPDKWDSIVKWAVASGNLQICQRRLTDTRVSALVEEGVPLPDGLNLEPYTKIATRRIAK